MLNIPWAKAPVLISVNTAIKNPLPQSSRRQGTTDHVTNIYDLKEIDADKHQKYTGVSNDLILTNLQKIVQLNDSIGKHIWIRTPLIPDFTASSENIRGLAHLDF